MCLSTTTTNADSPSSKLSLSSTLREPIIFCHYLRDRAGFLVFKRNPERGHKRLRSSCLHRLIVQSI
jgi:hypothetical protein